MPEERSRRFILSISATLGGSILAGCGQPSTDNSDEIRIQWNQDTTTTGAESDTAADQAAIIEATLDQTNLVQGESISVTIDIEGTEDEELTRTLPLSVNGQQLESQKVTLTPGETTQIKLTTTPPDTGTQTVTVGDQEVGTVVVRAVKPDTVRDVGAHYYPWYGAPLHSWNDEKWSLESPSPRRAPWGSSVSPPSGIALSDGSRFNSVRAPMVDSAGSVNSCSRRSDHTVSFAGSATTPSASRTALYRLGKWAVGKTGQSSVGGSCRRRCARRRSTPRFNSGDRCHSWLLP